MDNAFIQQSRKNINMLLASKKYKEAYDLCNAILSRYPTAEFEKLRRLIEKESEKANEEIVNEKLGELDPLWDDEKYAEILNGIRNLQKYAPNSQKLKDLYAKAQKLYLDQVEKLKKQFHKEQSKKLTRFLNEDPEGLMSELYKLERTNPGNVEVTEIVKDFRGKLIHKKITEKKELFDSDKYDVIQSFIDSLKKIDGKNEEIAELEKSMKQKKADNLIKEHKEFIFKGESYLETLVRLKKFSEAIKVAQEILSVDSNNKEAKKLLKKARNEYFNQTKDRSAEMIETDFEKLKKEYKEDKNKFVKI
ncbi:MAG: hypothetical protein WC285_00605 [Candidatus Gracilibacteria bacterium]|jgi:hypothetical protein